MSVISNQELVRICANRILAKRERVRLLACLLRHNGMQTIRGGGWNIMSAKLHESPARRARNDNRTGELLDSLHDLTLIMREAQLQKEKTFSLKNMMIPASVLPLLIGFLWQGNNVLTQYQEKISHNHQVLVERITKMQADQRDSDHQVDKRVSSLEATVTKVADTVEKLAVTVGQRSAERVYRPEIFSFCQRVSVSLSSLNTQQNVDCSVFK